MIEFMNRQEFEDYIELTMRLHPFSKFNTLMLKMSNGLFNVKTKEITVKILPTYTIDKIMRVVSHETMHFAIDSVHGIEASRAYDSIYYDKDYLP